MTAYTADGRASLRPIGMHFTGRPQVVICHQSGVFQGLFGDKKLGRFATKKVAIFEFLEKGWKSGDFEIEIGEKWLF